jgi:tetratricopeptide (TPR) repeat protein
MLKVVSRQSAVGSHKSSVVGHESAVVGHESAVVGFESSVVGHESSVIGHESSVVGFESSVVGHESSVVGHESGLKPDDSRLKTADSRLKTADSRLKTADSRLKTADSRLKTGDWRLATVLLLSLLPTPIPAASSLTNGPRLAAVYDTILAAKFDRVEAALARTCPPAPEEACQALRVVSAWWEILVNPESRLLDQHLTQLAAASIAASEAWTHREPQRAEAWFYLAASYAPLEQWRVLRGERLAAARDGKKIKDALERALQLDPALTDAYFGIGLYHYYADVAPAAAKILRFLFFLPGGDRVRGLDEMLKARDHGEVLRGEADYQLQIVYLWYEHEPDAAVEILERLDARYPTNPLFLQQIAETRDVYFHDHPASEAAWRSLLDRARAGRLYGAARTEVRAHLGLAVELDAMFESDRAIDELRAALDAEPQAMPYGAHARAELLLAAAYDRLGDRDLAVRAYTAAAADAPPEDTLQIRDRARLGLRQKPDARTTAAYRLSLEGWRALERGDPASAVSSLQQAVTIAPLDMVARYRYARALASRGDAPRARDALEQVIAARPPAPAIVLASAFVDYARLLERAGDRTRALTMYQYALDIVGSDPQARDDAARAVKRLSRSGPRQLF